MPYIEPYRDKAGYWYLDGPGLLTEDIENLIFKIPNRWQYLFVVTGKPFYVSPEWEATHRGGVYNAYEYAASYAIPTREVGRCLDATAEETSEDFFNFYLNSEETLKGWEDIREIKIVDQRRWLKQQYRGPKGLD